MVRVPIPHASAHGVADDAAGEGDARRRELAEALTVQAARLVRLARRTHSRSAGIRVLSILDETGPLGIGALAQADRCSQPTMTGQVKDLAEQGFVAKHPHPDDARSTLVVLTEAGLAELARVRGLNADLVTERLARRPELDTDDLARAVAVLQAVVDPSDLP